MDLVDGDDYVNGPVTTWLAGEPWMRLFLAANPTLTVDFMQRCLSTPESSNIVSDPSPTPLLRAWAKLRLTTGSWEDAMIAAANVSTLALASLVRLTSCWSKVRISKIYSLLGHL